MAGNIDLSLPPRNPPSGTVIACRAGGQVNVEFDFINDDPDNLGDFYLRVEGPFAASWVDGVGEKFKVSAAPLAPGILRLTLKPPLDAEPGQYAFQVKTMSGGMLVGNGPIKLILNVEPALHRPPPADDPKPVASPDVSPIHSAFDAIPTEAVTAAPAFPATNTGAAGQSRTPDVPPVASVAATFETPPLAAELPDTPVASASGKADAANTASGSPASAGREANGRETSKETSREGNGRERKEVESGFAGDAAEPPSAAWNSALSSAPPSASVNTGKRTESKIEREPANGRSTATRLTPANADAGTAPGRMGVKPEAGASNIPAPDTRPPQNAQTAAPGWTPYVESAPVLVTPGAEQGVHAPAHDAQVRETTREETASETQESAEETVVDPPDGAVFKMRPGETLLLRFNFKNETARTLTYILEETNPLEIGWTERVRENVNLDRNLEGEVMLRLKPPQDARPADYPFEVMVGPQGTQVLPRAMTLTVLPTPAVRLLAREETRDGAKESAKKGLKALTVKGGPFSRFLDFPLVVDSVGNSDTAFRIAVKAPRDERAESTATVGEAGRLYETSQWRFLFDKEMDTLKSPSPTMPPRPVNIRLRAQFKDAWWWGWGFQDTQQMLVEAVPVTDSGNGGKAENTVLLTAVRSRWLPFPALLLFPIGLAFLLLFGRGPDDVLPEKYTAQDAKGVYWVVAPPRAEAGDDTNNEASTTIQWHAGWISPLRLTVSSGSEILSSHFALGSGSYPTQVTVKDRSRPEPYTYRVSRWIGGADQFATVNFVAASKETPLLVNGQAGNETTVVIPRGGKTRLVLKNGASKPIDLSYWVVRDPDYNNSFFHFDRDVHSSKPNQGQEEAYTISGKVDGQDNGDQQLELVTTDANHPYVIIHLKLAEKGGR